MQDVINWRRRDSRTTLSGQPTEDQFAQMKSAGVRHVVNLGPHTNTGALPDETATLAALGLPYTYIPVDFNAPSQADFDQFCAALDHIGQTPKHVHCIYNARVSAFFYRYALEGRGGDVGSAYALMDGIWRPGGVWAAFIAKSEDIHKANRYAGYEY